MPKLLKRLPAREFNVFRDKNKQVVHGDAFNILGDDYSFLVMLFAVNDLLSPRRVKYFRKGKRPFR